MFGSCRTYAAIEIDLSSPEFFANWNTSPMVLFLRYILDFVLQWPRAVTPRVHMEEPLLLSVQVQFQLVVGTGRVDNDHYLPSPPLAE
jgi:hypothetical protein